MDFTGHISLVFVRARLDLGFRFDLDFRMVAEL